MRYVPAATLSLAWHRRLKWCQSLGWAGREARSRGRPAADGAAGSARRRWSGPPRGARRHLLQQLVSQVDQGDEQPVEEDQLRLAAAPSARLRSPPRAARSTDCRAASHGAANSANTSPKCARATPDRAGWEQTARAQVGFTTHPTRAVLLMSGPGRDDHYVSRGRQVSAWPVSVRVPTAGAPVCRVVPGSIRAAVGIAASSQRPGDASSR